MNEPTVDFDIDEVERRLGEGDAKNHIRDIKREAFLAGLRAFATVILGSRVTRRSIKSSPLYAMALAYVLRHPGYLDHFWSSEHMSKIAGISGRRMRAITEDVRRITAQPEMITRTHRKRKKRSKST